MSLHFREIEAGDLEALQVYYGKRPNRTCDSVVFDSFLWRKVYHVQFAVAEDEAVLWLYEENGEYSAAMPICPQDRLPYYFHMIQDYFNRVLKAPLQIRLADAEAVEYLGLITSSEYSVQEQAELKDYLYEAEALRTLSGKKLRKKKNHINYFEKEYAGRYCFRPLTVEDRGAIEEFLSRWIAMKGEDVEAYLGLEVEGIRDSLKHLEKLPVRKAGVFVDDALEAFTMGSYNEAERMAIIHIEKANPEIRGLYPFINREFLRQSFAEALWVNREDDMGQEGLRKAKQSYEPCDYARKYCVKQIWKREKS